MADLLSQIKALYARQEYLTPGAAETVQRILEVVCPDSSSLVLDVACGKGEAACVLAERTRCRVIAVDLYPLFFDDARAKIAGQGFRGNVTLVRADGKRLPVRDGTFDAAYCIGGPSIVGLEGCLRELARTVRAGGAVILSDIVWHDRPGPLGPEWRWFASMQQTTPDEYASAMEMAGLKVEEQTVFPRTVWDVYHRPMAQVTQAMRTRAKPEDMAHAEQIEADIEMERRAVESFVDYAMFVAQRL